ncbi:hypothetical protein F4810DRAFT_686501 [Camillea tinctor]|nr:hypothetical protein F4810DRAFT_686501 [Camillea tinctor]
MSQTSANQPTTENLTEATQPSSSPSMFTGKIDQIHSQYVKFWAHESAPGDVAGYRNAVQSHVYTPPPGKQWIKASTPFTEFKGEPLAESGDGKLLLIGNRESFDEEQYPNDRKKAGMSMVHLMVIPKERLFNGLSLFSAPHGIDDIDIIDSMISMFREAWEDRTVREKVVAHQKKAIDDRHKDRTDLDEVARGKVLLRCEELKQELERLVLKEDALKFEDFAFGLHLWPENSVGHLHMHVIATPTEFRKYSTKLHEAKTKDAYEVKEYLESLRSQAVAGHQNA